MWHWRRMTAMVTMAAAVLVTGSAAARDLDVVFVLDTTGSMSGELREVKERVHQLAESIAAARAGERLRFGVVAYRDRGDEYVTRVSPLTGDHAATSAFLATLRADGGGDGPEDVLAGLAAALDEVDWGPGERRIVLVGDAPPHLDYPDGPRPEELAERARTLAVVVDTIGCRSLPPDGVAFFRQAAYATEGRYQHIGRVAGEAGGVASAVLSAVAPVDASPGRPVAVRRASRRDPADGSGLLALPVVLEPGQGAAGCAIELYLPAGVALAETPEVRLSPTATHVQLELVAGDGGVELLTLDECPAPAAPVHLEIGG